jgi:protein-L-isoaspartate(D-aspartate) O-methyltransferase
MPGFLKLTSYRTVIPCELTGTVSIACLSCRWDTQSPPMKLDDCRRFYAEEVQLAANLDSPALVEAFARVPREKFLGPGPWQIAFTSFVLGGTTYRTIDDPRHLYHNVLIALDTSRGLNNGHPSSLAHWINALDLKTGDRVFHLGCGVGYYTAIMAEVIGPRGSVVASEVDSDLAARARENLAGYPNVTVHACDGAAFDTGTCDAMFINAGVTHPHLPWLERLGEGGRIVLPLTVARGDTGYGMGVMLKIIHDHGHFAAQVVSDVAIYSCTSVRDPRLEPLIGKALATKTLLKLKSVRMDPHQQSDTCILHGEDVCLSSTEPIAGPDTRSAN